MTIDPNHYANAHYANAHDVADRLTNVFTDHGATAEQVADLPDAGWAMAVTLAAAWSAKHDNPADRWTPRDGYLPSVITRSAVLAVLRFRERAAHTGPVDPFVGLS